MNNWPLICCCSMNEAKNQKRPQYLKLIILYEGTVTVRRKRKSNRIFYGIDAETRKPQACFFFYNNIMPGKPRIRLRWSENKLEIDFFRSEPTIDYFSPLLSSKRLLSYCTCILHAWHLIRILQWHFLYIIDRRLHTLHAINLKGNK